MLIKPLSFEWVHDWLRKGGLLTDSGYKKYLERCEEVGFVPFPNGDPGRNKNFIVHDNCDC